MTRLLRGLCVVAFATLILGCPKKKGDAEDASAEAAATEVADAAPPPAATAAATNENDISRFPDEKKLDNVTATIQRQTNVREIPGIGKVVATLAKGGTVTEIAQRNAFFLVVFDNPKDQKRLMGWVGQESFTAQAVVDAGVKIPACNVPETVLISDQPFCGKVCNNDVDCPQGQACKGAANRFTGGKLGDAVQVCTVFTAPRPVAVADAAVAPPPPPPPPPAAPKCPAGQAFVAQDKACHVTCVRPGTCPGAAPLCVACGALGNVCVGAGQRNLCK